MTELSRSAYVVALTTKGPDVSVPPMLNFRLVRLLWVILLSHGLLAAPLVLAVSPNEPLNIVVTIPVLKDLTEQVGGPHVRVTSLLSGYENEQTITKQDHPD